MPRERGLPRPKADALRCLKRILVRRIWQLLRTPADQDNALTINMNNNNHNNGNAPAPAHALT